MGLPKGSMGRKGNLLPYMNGLMSGFFSLLIGSMGLVYGSYMNADFYGFHVGKYTINIPVPWIQGIAFFHNLIYSIYNVCKDNHIRFNPCP